MLAAPEATAPPQNLPRITSRTKAPFCSAPKRHEPCLFIFSSKLRFRRNRAGTIKRVGTIIIVAIAASAAPGLKALLQPLGSTQPRPCLKMIVAASSQCIGKIGTWARLPITTVTRRAILPTNALSPTSKKTSIGLSNFLVADWCW